MKEPSEIKSVALKSITIMATAVLVTGCLSAKSPPTETSAPAEPVEEVVQAVSVPAPAPASVVEETELRFWTVATGDNLWGIASVEEVYNVPEKWPLIYKANLDEINDADLIYPGQILDIPRDSTQGQVNSAINHAKTRGAWAVGPIEASDKEYLRTAG